MNSIKMVSLLTLLAMMVGCSTHKATSQTNTLTSLADVNQQISQTLFSYVDKNRDKKVSQDEFINYSNEKSRLQELKHVQAMIASCDKNGDQQINLDEIPKRDAIPQVVDLNHIEPKLPCYISQREFDMKDSNHDNILTAEELLAKNKIPPYPVAEEVNPKDRAKRREAYLKKHYEACDKNSDGKLTLTEATSQKCRIPSEIFTQTDTNQDNFLTLEEIMKSAEEQESKTPVIAVPVQPLTPVELPPSMPVEIRMMVKMPQCDSNKDRKLSESEALSCGFSKELFQKSDVNSDGFFNQEDMEALHIIRQFQRIDRNRDGYLDIDEFQKGDRTFYMPY